MQLEVLDAKYNVLGTTTLDATPAAWQTLQQQFSQYLRTANVPVTRPGRPAFVRLKSTPRGTLASSVKWPKGPPLSQVGDTITFRGSTIRVDSRLADLLP